VKIDIHLTRRNKAILKKLCKDLFPYFAYVKVRKSGVVFKRKWYSLRKSSSHVAELVLLELPNIINSYYQENGLNPVFPKFGNMYSAIDHIKPLLGDNDIITYLDSTYSNVAFSLSLITDYDPEPTTREIEDIVIEQSKMIEEVFAESLDFYVKKVITIVEQYLQKVRTLYFQADLSCHSPPIRGPGEYRLTA